MHKKQAQLSGRGFEDKHLFTLVSKKGNSGGYKIKPAREHIRI